MLLLCYPVIRIISIGDRSTIRQKNLCHISIGIISNFFYLITNRNYYLSRTFYIHSPLIFRNNIFHSEVTRWYLSIVAVVTVVVAGSLYFGGVYDTVAGALRYAAFQVVSLISTAGFATADTTVWPATAIVLLISVSIVCGCAGSTTGGIKTDRFLLAIKTLRLRFSLQQHPNAVIRIKLDGMLQEDGVIHGVMIFIVTYMLAILSGTVFSALCGVDLLTGFSGTVACLGNVGPGFGEVYSLGNYAGIPAAVKFFNAFLMLLGRLEIFGLIQLFFLKWWR